MSTLQTLSNIEVGSRSNVDRNLEISPLSIVTLAAVAIGIMAAPAGIIKTADFDLQTHAYMMNTMCFFLPLILFFAVLDYASWYLFQSDIVKTLLTLPVENDKIYYRMRLGEKAFLKRNPFLVAFSIFIAFAFGFFSESIFDSVILFVYLLSLFSVIDSLAVIAVIKFFRVIMPFRKIILAILSVIFALSVIFMLQGSFLPEDLQLILRKVTKYHLIFYRIPFYSLLPIAGALFTAAHFLKKVEKRLWSTMIDRKILLSTAFPITGAKEVGADSEQPSGRPLESVSKHATTVFEYPLLRKSQILKRGVYLFTATFGEIHPRRIKIAIAAVSLVPFLLLLDIKVIMPFFIVMVSIVAIYFFGIICFFRNNPVPFAKYALPVGMLESLISTCSVVIPVFLLAGTETICLVKFLEYTGIVDLHRSTGFLLLDLVEVASAITVFLSFHAILSIPGKSGFSKTVLLVVGSLALFAAFISIFLFGSLYLVTSSSVLHVDPQIVLPQEELLTAGFKGISIFIMNFFKPLPMDPMNIIVNIPSAPFIMPAWLFFLSIVGGFWYFVLKYGRKIPKYRAPSKLMRLLSEPQGNCELKKK